MLDKSCYHSLRLTVENWSRSFACIISPNAG